MEDEHQSFVKLTENGFNYLRGDLDIISNIQLNHYIDLSKNDIDLISRQLWDIIGNQEDAPYYVGGSIFFNAIYPYIQNLPGSYAAYMEELRQKGASTSRVVWYKELLKRIDISNIPNFLQDLSIAINKLYGNEPQELDGDIDWSISQQHVVGDATLQMPVSKTDITKKTVFITYCWENKPHINWVHNLSSDLQQAGFNVIIDVKQPLGIELNKFMEDTISHADKVLIIATPEYKRRADNREYGVGYETSLITDDLIKDQNRIKFIPIIRQGDKNSSYPRYLGNRKGLGMTKDEDYQTALKELIENIQNHD